jgi:predicted regulator of Ras-like GTPase activity (Roadblock/LC7/MglB family)
MEVDNAESNRCSLIFSVPGQSTFNSNKSKFKSVVSKIFEEEAMKISTEMQKEIDEITKVPGYICYGLVNYQKGVSAVNEDSDPNAQSNYFPQQCTAIMKSLVNSLGNLNGGSPKKLIVEASKMTMMIFPVNEIYFCGVGLQPGIPPSVVEQKLEALRSAFAAALNIK